MELPVVPLKIGGSRTFRELAEEEQEQLSNSLETSWH
jgi:hypothetical protein